MEASKAPSTRRAVQADSKGLGVARKRDYVGLARPGGKTAALSPRTEIDFLSIHSTAQMSSFDNCCVIECAEY